jgi:uncharacterized cysteine cluster protein YcgN (CxxCxxCC family)
MEKVELPVTNRYRYLVMTLSCIAWLHKLVAGSAESEHNGERQAAAAWAAAKEFHTWISYKMANSVT